MLDYIYITNAPDVARIAEAAGVNEIFVDLETIGKEERQRGMNTVKSRHTVGDVAAVKKALRSARLLVRVNSIHAESEREIRAVKDAGADIIMLPYFKTIAETEAFLGYCGGQVQTRLLIETPEAVAQLDRILSLPGIDSIHVGLNDLHLGMRKTFMFELLTDGTVDRICEISRAHGVPYGVGGVAGLEQGTLPAEYILAEHYRLGSSAVILSRSFCDLKYQTDLTAVRAIFQTGVRAMRAYESALAQKDAAFFVQSHAKTAEIVKKITEGLLP